MKRHITIFLLTLCSALLAPAQVVKVSNGSYTSSFDIALQCTRQVEYVLHDYDIGDAKRHKSWRFINDIFSVDALANHDDYTKSGYQRGHMCPAQDRSRSIFGMKKTFRISNIAPQVARLNTGTWKSTENLIRRWVPLHGAVRVICLPLWLDRDTTFIGAHRVAVPHAFVKVAIAERNDSLLATWFYWNRK